MHIPLIFKRSNSHALQSAIALEKYAGKAAFVELYTALAGQLTQTIKDKYWDESRKLSADTQVKDAFYYCSCSRSA